MTKVSYVIKRNDIQFETYTSYMKAVQRFERIKQLADKPWQFTIEVVYTNYNPDKTEDSINKAKARREKFWEIKRLKEELKHAPSYINVSGVGTC